jgi:hypothetical protein
MGLGRPAGWLFAGPACLQQGGSIDSQSVEVRETVGSDGAGTGIQKSALRSEMSQCSRLSNATSSTRSRMTLEACRWSALAPRCRSVTAARLGPRCRSGALHRPGRRSIGHVELGIEMEPCRLHQLESVPMSARMGSGTRHFPAGQETFQLIEGPSPRWRIYNARLVACL